MAKKTPNLTQFKRKVERLIGRFHGDLVDVLAKRPHGAAKADPMTDVWREFMQTADDFFAEAMELGVAEAEAHLQRTAPPELVAKLKADLHDRLAAFDTIVNENLRADVEDGQYEAEDPDAQADRDDVLDDRLGRYADALHPIAYHGLSSTVFDSGVLMVWALDPAAESCADCPALEAGNPYCDPDEDVEGATPLPTYPGDGDTECLSNCRCSLEFEERSWEQYVEDNDLAA